MVLKLAQRMSLLEPYLFAELDKKKTQAREKGVDVISLSIGDPDLPTPKEIQDVAKEALTHPENHRYPDYAGSEKFRKAASVWMKRRFGIELDPEREIVSLIGSKEGIFNTSFVLAQNDDAILCPEPGYPVYAISARLAGAEPSFMPLLKENGFLPELSSIPGQVARKAVAMWINYPNNPTGAVASEDFLKQAIEFAHENDLVLCSDAAYSEICFDGYKAPSILELPGAMDVAVEFHSMSKSYNMTGWRVGFVAGRADVVQALAQYKSNMDSGVFGAVQDAAIRAMELWPAPVSEVCRVYKRRRDILVSALEKAGFVPGRPLATFYIWMKVPGGNDKEFCERLIDEVGVLATPGSGFGPSGIGYVRFSLTVHDDRLQQAAERICTMDIVG